MKRQTKDRIEYTGAGLLIAFGIIAIILAIVMSWSKR